MTNHSLVSEILWKKNQFFGVKAVMIKDFYSTGEIAELLNISITTVSRKFDKGIFTGKKNVITGDRFISKESLLEFMKRFNISTLDIEANSSKRILLGTCNKLIQSEVLQVFQGDKRFIVETVLSGYDALIKCSQKMPDVFLLDHDLPNIFCKKAVEILKDDINLASIKIVCFSKSSKHCNHNKCLVDYSFIDGNFTWENIKNKVSKLLGIGKPVISESPGFEHYRKWPRIKIRVSASVELFPDTGELKDVGDTIIENISIGGAYLVNINLKNKALFETSRLFLKVDHPPFEKLNEECKFVRLNTNGYINAGIKFTSLNENSRNQILSLMV